jgi:NADP-dependent 3-hydroxy acid dehydrogenase YdfG
MFYTSTEKKAVKDTFDYVEDELRKLRVRVTELEAQLILAKEFPHGAKKDGTPKKKPGRKAK